MNFIDKVISTLALLLMIGTIIGHAFFKIEATEATWHFLTSFAIFQVSARKDQKVK